MASSIGSCTTSLFEPFFHFAHGFRQRRRIAARACNGIPTGIRGSGPRGDDEGPKIPHKHDDTQTMVSGVLGLRTRMWDAEVYVISGGH